jgi:glycosyltransferase involved in cell wall biosynthesis
MAVYNGERYLRQAVQSVLGQTLSDFELVIIDDGSTDGSAGLLREFLDPRIRIITNPRNEGLTRCLIRGCGEARGKYIARMDADDISYPQRFEKQVEFLEAHPDHAVVGCRCHYVDSGGEIQNTSGHFLEDDEIKKDVWRRSPIVHGSAMFVRECLLECGGYREIFRCAQDYDLWLRLVGNYKMANLPDVLYGYRYHRSSITLQRLYLQSQFVELARELARERIEMGSDALMRGETEVVQQEIDAWNSDGFLKTREIRSATVNRLLPLMASCGNLQDVSILWLTALVSNPLNAGLWKFLLSKPFRLRLKKSFTKLFGKI